MKATDNTIVWPDDSTCVDVKHEDELVFWCRRFGVSTQMLRQAVKIVGDRFKDVAYFLNSRRLPEHIGMR